MRSTNAADRRVARRHARWTTVGVDDVDRAERWFERHGGKAVLLGRPVPALRTPVSLPAGVASMPWVAFAVPSAIGTVLWTGALAGAGYLLEERFERVRTFVEPVGNAAIAALVAWYLWRAVRGRRSARDPGRGAR